jgi:TrmH family RNA methyltransferase
MSGIFFTKLYICTREEALSVLADVPILAADMDGENIFTFDPPEKFALAIGNEANGISDEVAKKASFTVRIPMRETQESLNAAVSAGIAMYELKRDRFKISSK